jgi:hypothetical protein
MINTEKAPLNIKISMNYKLKNKYYHLNFMVLLLALRRQIKSLACIC